MRQRISVVDEDRIVADNPGPTSDAWHNPLEATDRDGGFNSTLENRPDQALGSMAVAYCESAFAVQLGHEAK